MKYSEDRIKSLALKIHDKLYLDEDVDYVDEDKALVQIKKAMLNYFQLEDTIDEKVRAKINSLQREVHPGTNEWNTLYRQYYEEEIRKHKM